MTAQTQSDLFHVVDLDAQRREIFRNTINQQDLDFFRAHVGKPPEARARYIWNASRGPDIPKPRTLRQLLTMTPRKRPAGLRVDGGHPPRGLTPSNLDQGLIVDIIQHVESRLESETGPVVVHLFNPEPRLKSGSRPIYLHAELYSALRRHDRVRFKYVDPADWALS